MKIQFSISSIFKDVGEKIFLKIYNEVIDLNRSGRTDLTDVSDMYNGFLFIYLFNAVWNINCLSHNT